MRERGNRKQILFPVCFLCLKSREELSVAPSVSIWKILLSSRALLRLAASTLCLIIKNKKTKTSTESIGRGVGEIAAARGWAVEVMGGLWEEVLTLIKMTVWLAIGRLSAGETAERRPPSSHSGNVISRPVRQRTLQINRLQQRPLKVVRSRASGGEPWECPRETPGEEDLWGVCLLYGCVRFVRRGYLVQVLSLWLLLDIQVTTASVAYFWPEFTRTEQLIVLNLLFQTNCVVKGFKLLLQPFAQWQ